MNEGPHPKWPEPPQTLSQRLLHTLDIHEGQSDDMKLIVATSGEYADYGQPHSWTGLTLGDLRALTDILVGQVYTIADYDLACQFGFTGDLGPHKCSRCGAPRESYFGGDCPKAIR